METLHNIALSLKVVYGKGKGTRVARALPVLWRERTKTHLEICIGISMAIDCRAPPDFKTCPRPYLDRKINE